MLKKKKKKNQSNIESFKMSYLSQANEYIECEKLKLHTSDVQSKMI